jgi:large subunit ribosomal protein L1
MAKKKVVMDEEAEVVKDDSIDKELAPEESETDQEIDLETAEEETGTREEIASEVAAMSTDNDTAKEATKKTAAEAKKSKAKASKQSKKSKSKKVKSKKYIEIEKTYEKDKSYSVADAAEIVKKLSYSKFDGSLTLDVKLAKPKKGDDAVRGTIKLPHGTGKVLNVAIASDELIEKIKKGTADFDILITSPAMMPKLGQVAKILGPKGKMPNPKDGTVVENPEEAAKELNQTARYRADIGRNLHIMVGKVSWDAAKITENIQVALKALAHLKKDSASISPTMGPSVKIDL